MKINTSILNGRDIGGVVGVFGRKATCALNVERMKAAIINATVYIGHGVIVIPVTAA
jgi:hypothetical protein